MMRKNRLDATSDVEPLICEYFIVNGCLAGLYLYPTQLLIIKNKSTQTIPIDFDFSYSIIQEKEQPTGIEFTTPTKTIKCIKQFFYNLTRWEEALISIATRNGFHDLFRVKQKLGNGSFANVYLVYDCARRRQVAVKAFKKQIAFKDDGKKAIQNEIKIMRMIKSKYLASLYGVYQTPNSLYLTMEFTHKTTLADYLDNNKIIPIDNRKRILRALLNGVADMQKCRVIHRDLKPQNVIVSKDLQQIKIIDFGLATNIDEKRYIFLRCGTAGYMAPQILKLQRRNAVRLQINSDMFSVGVIYYYMLFRKPLFSGNNQEQVIRRNKECKVIVPTRSHSGIGQIQLLKAMLQINPSKRITPELALKSKFLRQGNAIQNTKIQQCLKQLELKDQTIVAR